MSYSASDLQMDADRQLRTLGYEICGDDDDGGWYWTIGSFRSTSANLAFDSAAEATADAVRDLVQRGGELLAAARLAVSRWSEGDLAEAIRELDVCVKAFPVVAETDGVGTGDPSVDR